MRPSIFVALFRGATLAIAIATVSTLGIAPPAVAAGRVDYPSWADVQAARGSEAATRTQVAAITALLVQLDQEVTIAQAEEQKRGDLYATALQAFDEQVVVATELQTQADDAEVEAGAAKKLAARLISNLSRSGSEDLTASLLTQSGSADSLLYRLGTMNRLSEKSTEVYAAATRLQNTAQSLSNQAAVAQKALDELRVAAEAAFAEAQKAAEAAQAALLAQQENQARLQAQLAVLVDKREATEADYNAGVAERLAAQLAANQAGVVNASGWARPSTGYITSPYGMRVHPIYGTRRLHTGTDISGQGCGAPIFAARGGTVNYAGWNGTYGYHVQIDHGDGTSSSYSHILAGGILVANGQQVSAGQQIAKVGTTGASTGCHVHFSIRVGGQLTDPVQFMRDRGVGIG